MLLTLVRQFQIADATIGALSIDGKFQCHTLEDIQRDKKIAGKTAIPCGNYNVTLEASPRFSAKYKERGLGAKLPRLHGVPGFEGVLIHIGNTAADTHGCILVGSWARSSKNAISGSTAAYKKLHKALSDSTSAVRIAITSEVVAKKEELRHPSKVMYDSLYPTFAPEPPKPGFLLPQNRPINAMRIRG
jgi:hypothetical protein